MTYPIPRASIWPNVVFDTSSAKGMAAAQAWIASHVPERPVEPRTGENDTQTHEDTQTDTQGASANQSEWFHQAVSLELGLIRAAAEEARRVRAAAEEARRTGDWEPTAPAPPVFNSIEPQTPTPQRRRTDRVLYGDIEGNLNT